MASFTPKQIIPMVVLVDTSASMMEQSAESFSAVSSFVVEQKKVDPTSPFTLSTFNNTVKVEISNIPVGDVEIKPFACQGMTALYDGIGTAIKTQLDQVEHKSVIFLIVTDGAENSSQEYTREMVVSLIKKVKETHGWKVIFMGASEDIVLNAINIGLTRAACAVWDPHTPGAFSEVVRGVSSQVALARETSNAGKPLPDLDIRSYSTPSRSQSHDQPPPVFKNKFGVDHIFLDPPTPMGLSRGISIGVASLKRA
jgi:uncharacterized protein YegL